jgi:GNAT superfamily N-acetyltransferase
LAHHLARKLAPLGQQAVQFSGYKWQMVHRLAVGTGAITDVRRMAALGADVVLTTDDGMRWWRDGAWAADEGLPVIAVNHRAAEIPGLLKLADYLRAQFPGIPVKFVGPTCAYEIFATERYHDVGVRMRRDSLDGLPPVAAPEGFSVRPMAEDERWAYIQVMNRSIFAGEADADWFERTYAQDPEYDASFLQLVWQGERPVAAAGAWHLAIDGERWGMIHWVGADREIRGHGLGKLATLAALRRLRERGFGRAMLDTQDWRMAAIAAYLRLGFQPWPNERAPQAVWNEILDNLDRWRQAGRP